MSETRAADRIEAARERLAVHGPRGEVESHSAGGQVVWIADAGVRREGILPRSGRRLKSASRASDCVGRGRLTLVRIPAKSRHRRIQTAGADFQSGAGDG